jgi:tetratricopeptide (TPR) repeat protein
LPDHGSATWASDRARDAYLRGRYLVDQGSRDQVAKGVPFLRAALKADRGFLPAHLGLSEAHRILGEFGTARQHADLALEISPQSAEAHLNLATLLMEAEWNWDEAGSHLEEAIRLDPDSPKARQQAAVRLAIVGEMPRALAQMDVAMRLDPVSTLIRTDYGWLLYYAGRHAEAIASCQQALELEARLLGAHLCIERAATAMGDAAVAADAALQAMNLWRAAAEDIAGVAGAPVAEASRAFSEWRLRFYANYPDQSRISAEDMAEANAAVGRFDAALTHLERATEARSRYLPLLLADPLLAPLRGDARFDALLTEVRKGFLRA